MNYPENEIAVELVRKRQLWAAQAKRTLAREATTVFLPVGVLFAIIMGLLSVPFLDALPYPSAATMLAADWLRAVPITARPLVFVLPVAILLLPAAIVAVGSPPSEDDAMVAVAFRQWREQSS